MKSLHTFSFSPKSKQILSFILLYFCQQMIFATNIEISISPFYCDQLDWNTIRVYEQTHSIEVQECLHNAINNKRKGFQEAPDKYYFHLAKTYYNKTDYQLAKTYAQEALINTQKSLDSASVLLFLSRIHRSNDDISAAQLNSLKALNIAKEKNNDETIALARIELARINYTLKDSLVAMEQLLQIRDIVESSENQNIKGQFTYQKARINYWYNGNPEQIEFIINDLLEALGYFTKTQSYTEIATTLDFLGICSVNKEALDEAENYYQQSLHIKHKLGNTYGQAVSYHNLAYLSYMRNDIVQTIEYFKKSAELSEDIQALELLTSTYANIATFYETVEEPDSAITYFRKQLMTKDSLQQKQKTELVYEFRTKYKTQEKEQQIKLQRQQLSYLGLTAGLLGLIASLIFFLYRQKHRLNKVISKQKNELEELNSFKNQLFSIIGHDLRGMMSKLNIAQRRIERSYKTSDNIRPVSKMGSVIQGLNGFIENILYWGFSHTDRLHIDRHEIDVQQLTEQVSHDFEYDLTGKNIILKQEIPEGFVLNGDTNTLKVVLRNIIANAIKYSHTNGVILVKALENKKEKIIQVIDGGVGIPPAKIPLLFAVNNEKVSRGTANEKGTGLGLWLCKEMMTKNKGEISVTSVPNVKTCFSLHFPKAL